MGVLDGKLLELRAASFFEFLLQYFHIRNGREEMHLPSAHFIQLTRTFLPLIFRRVRLLEVNEYGERGWEEIVVDEGGVGPAVFSSYYDVLAGGLEIVGERLGGLEAEGGLVEDETDARGLDQEEDGEEDYRYRRDEGYLREED